MDGRPPTRVASKGIWLATIYFIINLRSESRPLILGRMYVPGYGNDQTDMITENSTNHRVLLGGHKLMTWLL